MKTSAAGSLDNDVDRVALAESALLHELGEAAGAPERDVVALAFARAGDCADNAGDGAVGRCLRGARGGRSRSRRWRRGAQAPAPNPAPQAKGGGNEPLGPVGATFQINDPCLPHR